MLLMTNLRKGRVPSKTKDVNVKVFNKITRVYKAKAFVNHISSDFKYQLNSSTCNSDQNGMVIHANASVRNFVRAKKIIFGILAHAFVRIASI